MEIRSATKCDRDAVIALWELCGLTRPWNDPAADFDRGIEFSGSTILLGESGSQTIATAMTGYDGHRGWIYYLGVAPEYRRRGHARELLQACTSWLAERGCPKVELMVREGNPDAALYERLGWEEQGVRTYGLWIDRGHSQGDRQGRTNAALAKSGKPL